jgi:hypothetical protein
VDTDPTHIPVRVIDCSHMHTTPDLKPDIANGIPYRPSAHDRLPWLVEEREEAVAGSRDLTPTETAQLTTHPRVMLLQNLAPSTVAQLCGALGRTDDVSE